MAGYEEIRALVRRAKRKMRLQYLLDGLTLGLALGLMLATVLLGAVKAEFLDSESYAVAGALLGLAGGFLWGMLRKLDEVSVAAAIDRSNHFADRLSSALEFGKAEEQTPFMKAQIADTLQRLDEVDPGRAHRFRVPKDIHAVVIFGVALAVMVWVNFPEEAGLASRQLIEKQQVVEEEYVRTNLDPGLALFRQDQVEELLKEAEETDSEEAREAAEELKELLEQDQRGELSPEEFNDKLNAIAEKLKSNCEEVDMAALFAELGLLSPRFKEAEFMQPLRETINEGAFGSAVKVLDGLAEQVVEEEAMAAGLDEKAFYQKLDKIIESRLLCTAKELAKVEEQLKKAAEELEKNDETKELAEALKKGDEEKAASALEELAKKMANGDIDPKSMEKIAKLLEKFADKLDLNDPELAKKMKKYEKELSKLKKKLEKKGKLSSKEQRKLKDLEKKLKKLQREQEKKERGEAGRRLKRLTKHSKQAADEVRKAAKKEQGDKKNEESGAKQAADEMRKLDRDQQGESSKDDVKEASERLKEDARRSQGGQKKKGQPGEQGEKGEGDTGQDERANKIDDYLKRAKGQDPGEGKPGEGQKGDKSGQKSNGNGQPGEKKGDESSNQAGKGSEDPMGAKTHELNSNREDTHVTGDKGAGPSRAETIKKASQSGFANRNYREVYEDYEKAVEGVLEQERVPPGYKHYVRRYFDFIRPQEER